MTRKTRSMSFMSERQRRVLAASLTVIMVLTLGLMMLSPASAGAFPGKNGKIVFDAPDASLGGNLQIFVMNPDGTGLQELTHNAKTSICCARWSPDGTKIAYTNGTNNVSQIWAMNADGSGPYEVTPGTWDFFPSWSPDGTKIAYSDAHDNLAVMNADGSGTPTELTTGGQHDGYPSWSPDGTKIAFSRSSHLYVLTVATLSVSQLLTTSGEEPCWSPDGSKIVYTDAGGIYVVNANGGTPTLINKGPYFWPDWSPDGTKIAVAITPDSIWIMNADGSGTPTALTPNMLDANDPDFQRLPIPTIVSGFTITPNPSSLSLAPGGQGTSTITIQSQGLFSSPVTLTASGSGFTFGFSPNPAPAPSATGQSSTTLTVTVAGAPVGTQTITITGTGGGMQSQTTLTVTVTGGGGGAPGFPIESILVGIVAGVAVLTLLRHRREQALVQRS
jgi:Tol biopolymer transport system component